MLLSVVHVLFKLVDNTTCVVGMYVLVAGPYIAGESKENHLAIKVPSLSLTLRRLCERRGTSMVMPAAMAPTSRLK
jgi:hypothetical protein